MELFRRREGVMVVRKGRQELWGAPNLFCDHLSSPSLSRAYIPCSTASVADAHPVITDRVSLVRDCTCQPPSASGRPHPPCRSLTQRSTQRGWTASMLWHRPCPPPLSPQSASLARPSSTQDFVPSKSQTLLPCSMPWKTAGMAKVS